MSSVNTYEIFTSYTYFALQKNGGWCGSSANANQTYAKYGASTNCNSNGTGGPWANNVYKLNPMRKKCFNFLVFINCGWFVKITF